MLLGGLHSQILTDAPFFGVRSGVARGSSLLLVGGSLPAPYFIPGFEFRKFSVSGGFLPSMGVSFSQRPPLKPSRNLLFRTLVKTSTGRRF